MNGNRFVDLIVITVAVLGGLIIGAYFHPYEQCSRMYEDPNDIVECIWIKEND